MLMEGGSIRILRSIAMVEEDEQDTCAQGLLLWEPTAPNTGSRAHGVRAKFNISSSVQWITPTRVAINNTPWRKVIWSEATGGLELTKGGCGPV